MKITTPFISFALKIVGTVMFVASLIDYLFLLIPFNWTDDNWQITTTNSLVDRGIVPLLGITLILIGWWITDNAANAVGKPIPALRLTTFILASILGLIFLLLVRLIHQLVFQVFLKLLYSEKEPFIIITNLNTY